MVEQGGDVEVTQNVVSESPIVEHNGDSEVTGDDVNVSVEEVSVEESELPLADEQDASVDNQERNVVVGLDDGSVELPPLLTGGNREELVTETREDKSLEAWRKLADVKAKGFKWKRNLLFHAVTDNVLQSVDVPGPAI